jgi:hypothetical protein
VPLAIPPHTSLVGDGGGSCRILYNPIGDPGPVDAAFAITGVGYVTIDSLSLETASTHPPGSVLELGRVKGYASLNSILNSTIDGYATKAIVYSQASENNIWLNDTFIIRGGGARYVFYTTGYDDLGICAGCKEETNLSLYLENFVILEYVKDAKITAIADHVGLGSGDHYFERGYIGLNHDARSIGLEFISARGLNSGVSIKDIRIENGGYGLYFTKKDQSTLHSLNIEGVTWDSNVGYSLALSGTPDQTYFAYGDDGLTLDLFTMSHDVANRHGATGPSSFDSMTNSTLNESYGTISIRNMANGNIFMVRKPGSISLPDSQRPLNAWVFGNNVREVGGELKASPAIVATSHFHIIRSGAGPITSIKPPPNFQIGEILKLENSSGVPLQFALGRKSTFTLPPDHFVSLLWDGGNWVPGI